MIIGFGSLATYQFYLLLTTPHLVVGFGSMILLNLLPEVHEVLRRSQGGGRQGGCQT